MDVHKQWWEKTSMKIGIDARFFGPKSKGLGRYTQKLIEHLEKIDHTNTYVIFLHGDNFEEYTPRNKNFTKVMANYRWYSFAEQIFFPFTLARHKCDFVHFPHFNVPLLYRGAFLVTIHDLILIHFPTLRATTLNPLFYWIKFFMYKIVIRSAIMRSDTIFAVSQFTRDDILSHYDVATEKIIVTHESGFERVDAAELATQRKKEQRDIIKPYLLYVGNAYPHKNLERLVLAFKELRAHKECENVHLVLVGRDDYFYQELEKNIVHNDIENISVVHDVDDAALRTLYANACAYVFPSLYEGFGLPPLEAFAYNVPVASSDHPCMQEICDDAVLYFDGTDIASITAVMKEIITNTSVREQLRKKGYERITKFSWDRMARQTHDAYQQHSVNKESSNG